MSDEDAKEIVTLASILPLAEALAALEKWKVDRIATYWIELDQAVQRVTAEAIRLWPNGEGNVAGLLAVVEASKDAMREAAKNLGLPPGVLPFTDAPPKRRARSTAALADGGQQP